MNRLDDVKFSVLIPVYKKEKPEYFNEALNSVYTQTMSPSEVVICEDGKLSRELEVIIEKYKKRFPEQTRIIKYPRNRGLGRSLHDGVIECSNEIIFRMDSDDISRADRFEKQLDVMRKTGVDVVGSNITEFDEKMEKRFGVREVPEKDSEIKRYAKFRNPMNHMTVCFKKSKVLEAGNYLDMSCFEDYYLWVRMMNNGCIFYNIQESLVNVRGGDSMLKRRGGKAYTRKMIAFEKELKKVGFISLGDYYKNIFVRLISSLIPVSLRNWLYYSLLRKKA